MHGRKQHADCDPLRVQLSSIPTLLTDVGKRPVDADHRNSRNHSDSARGICLRMHILGRLAAISALLSLLTTGCYAPLHSGGIDASTLSDEFRWPQRTSSLHLNYSSLVGPAPAVYLLGPGDRLEVTVPDLIANGNVQSFQVTVLDQGEIHLPRLGPVMVGGLSLSQAQQQINSSLAGTLLQNPSALVSLVEKGTINVLVLGAVKQPGVHALPRFENDVAHALAAAQGLAEDSGDVIEVHRREQFVSAEIATSQPEIQRMSFQSAADHPAVTQPALMNNQVWPQSADSPNSLELQYLSQGHSYRYGGHSLGRTASQPPTGQVPHVSDTTQDVCPAGMPIIRIPLRGIDLIANPSDVVLNASDVVVVPRRQDKVFYVVGPLSEQSRIRFSVGDRDREIGNGLLLPDDREVDVVTAVAMAGYIDPIESPTTVTVHRTDQAGMPILIKVDLIAARSDPQETVLVHAGDIIYLNPDPWWYYRRTMDRVIDTTVGVAIGRWLTN